MDKVSVLIGIGFMLVSALNYSLPMEQDVWRLVPALVGLTISVVGLMGLRGAVVPRNILFSNMICCFLLIVYSILRIIPDSSDLHDSVELTSNLSLILCSMLFIHITQHNLREISV